MPTVRSQTSRPEPVLIQQGPMLGGGASPVTVAAGTTTAALCPGPRPGFATVQPSGHPGPGPCSVVALRTARLNITTPPTAAPGGWRTTPRAWKPHPHTRSRPVRQRRYLLPANHAQPDSSPRLWSHLSHTYWSAPQNTKEAINEVTREPKIFYLTI